MSGLDVSATTVAAIQDDPYIWILVAEYEAEAKSPEMRGAMPQWAQYAAWEAAGILDAFAARSAGRLIGFVSVLHSYIPHYGRAVAIVESLFVTKGSRRTGAGAALIRAAEAVAAENGSPLLVTAPAGSALEAILPRRGYRHSNTVFVKGPPCRT